MDNNMSSMINQLLSNPESMKKLMELANSMGITQSTAPSGQQGTSQEQPAGQSADGTAVPAMAQSAPAINNGTTEALSRAVQALGSLNSAPAANSRHTSLLMALKPYMRTQRQERLDGAMKLLSAVRMFRNMGGGQ